MNEATSAGTGSARRVQAFQRFVSDLERSIDFYCGALGFELGRVRIPSDPGSHALGSRLRARKHAALVLGDERLELVAVDRVTTHVLREACTSANSLVFQHFAIVASDMDAAFSRLARFSPEMISTTGPIRLPPAAGAVTAVKFRDPDGHPIELIAFPAGRGNARWQHRGLDAITLGIDHSAIVVADAARSIAFYRDVLGLCVAARQVNHGPEQDRLDGLEDVEVDVVALSSSAAATPHLELLGYRQPRPVAQGTVGLASPPFGDCIVWQAENFGAIAATLASHGKPILEARESGSDPEELLLRDPDGHAHLLLSVRRAAAFETTREARHGER